MNPLTQIEAGAETPAMPGCSYIHALRARQVIRGLEAGPISWLRSLHTHERLCLNARGARTVHLR